MDSLKGPDEITSTAVTSPPAWLLPFLKTGARNLEAAASRDLSFLPPGMDSGVAPMSAERGQALDMFTGLANDPSGLGGASVDELMRQITGGVVDDESLGRLADIRVRDAINPIIGGSIGTGRQGSGLVADAAARAGTEAALGTFIPAALQEAQLAQGAVGLAPTAETLRGAPAALLERVGLSRESQGQREIDDIIRQFQFEQGAPMAQAREFLAGVTGLGGVAGGTSTQSQPVFSDPLSTILGAGLTFMGMPTNSVGGQMFGFG